MFTFGMSDDKDRWITKVDSVISYIENQHRHHDIQNFQNEYRELLKEYKVEYDEKYVWD
jgi:putative transposase